MPNLIETSYYTRKTIKYGAIALVVMIIGRVILGAAISWWQRAHPAPPPPPTVGFGQLPPLTFPKQEVPELTYQLETVSGDLPVISDRSNVYFMPVIRPNLLALQRATETAASLGFVFEPQSLSDRLYRFSRSSPLPSRMDFDIITGNFDISVDWFNRETFLQEKNLPNNLQAISEAESYLNRADLLSTDLTGGQRLVTYLQASGKGYKPAVSLSEADFVQIDFFRNEIEDGVPIVTSKTDEGIIRVIISGSREQGLRVVGVKYDYYPLDQENFEDYPIKTPNQAWQELQVGGGHIVSLPNGNSVVVRSVELGFYDAFQPQTYMQPVYIFSGDRGFSALVPAIDNTWIQIQ
jgi:hypothetical protein